MQPFLLENFGNPASRQHVFGWRAQAAVDVARLQVARAIGADPEEIIFTSGATESNNLAILGATESLSEKGRHVITVATEHKSVLDPCASLEKKGWAVSSLPVDRFGLVDPQEVGCAIRPDTVLISVMAANNEIGALQPIAEIARIARERGVLFHTDAAQAIGKVPISVAESKIDLLSISGHKVYGPKGIGALFLRRSPPRFRLTPRFYGGGHEGGLRSGTLNVPGVVGLGAALELATAHLAEESRRVGGLRDRLERRLTGELDGVSLNGPPERRLFNNLNLRFSGVSADRLMMEIRDIAVSSGSACTTASPQPSHVLKAIGLTPEAAKESLRFGLGRFNTPEEVEAAADQIIAAVRSIRASESRA
jgi:cysteine desulfurase